MDSLRHVDHNNDQEKITKKMLALLAKRVLVLLMRIFVRKFNVLLFDNELL